MEIRATGITHRYRNQSEPTLRSVSCTFAPGTLTSLTGPSGCGKSTLLYALALMLTPSEGSVLWGGSDTQRLRDVERTRLRACHSGFVFQDAVLDLALTGRENVLEAAWLSGISSSLASRRASALMERFGVADRADHRPAELSGGQAQRIALCRALIREPSVIFADEPTGNLDEDSAAVVWGALRQAAAQGATVVVATHDLRRATDADAILRLSDRGSLGGDS